MFPIGRHTNALLLGGSALGRIELATDCLRIRSTGRRKVRVVRAKPQEFGDETSPDRDEVQIKGGTRFQNASQRWSALKVDSTVGVGGTSDWNSSRVGSYGDHVGVAELLGSPVAAKFVQ